MIFLLDDARARRFEPFSTSRPLSEMRVGALVQRQRWQQVLRASCQGAIVAPHLAGFEEFDAPPHHGSDVPAGAWLVNSRAVPTLLAAESAATVLVIDQQVAAVRLAAPVAQDQLHDPQFTLDDVLPDAGPTTTIPGLWLEEVWDIVGQLQSLLLRDIPALVPALGARPLSQDGVTVLGDHGVFVAEGATVEPQVVFDTTAGPVLLSRGASVQAFSRVVGPCFVGESSAILGGRVSGCSIGEVCRVHGEVSVTTFVGHANKGHDGFVGHSVLGRWVNLGSGTITSNLKNTYGTVSLWTPDGLVDTGMQFLGTLFGDHAKTGIGLRLTTGCVIGTGANVYDNMPPKAVAPFSWGGSVPYAEFAVDKFVEMAERMMVRRQVGLTDDARQWWRQVHAGATGDLRWPRR
jgi:UDP-N-acetylglucosamine diphosphorylase/glucosamine-1-phosphate N-acetyltransferase